jgi:hypothetical protein
MNFGMASIPLVDVGLPTVATRPTHWPDHSANGVPFTDFTGQ